MKYQILLFVEKKYQWKIFQSVVCWFFFFFFRGVGGGGGRGFFPYKSRLYYYMQGDNLHDMYDMLNPIF